MKECSYFVTGVWETGGRKEYCGIERKSTYESKRNLNNAEKETFFEFLEKAQFFEEKRYRCMHNIFSFHRWLIHSPP